jgi:hypothetical protein
MTYYNKWSMIRVLKFMKGESIDMRKYLKGFLGAIVALCSAGSAMAATPLTTAAGGVSMADAQGGLLALFGIIIAVLAVVWGIRKIIKLTNRS